MIEGDFYSDSGLDGVLSLFDFDLFEDKKDLEDDGLNGILSQSLDLIEERINCVESRSLVESSDRCIVSDSNMNKKGKNMHWKIVKSGIYLSSNIILCSVALKLFAFLC